MDQRHGSETNYVLLSRFSAFFETVPLVGILTPHNCPVPRVTWPKAFEFCKFF